MTFWDWLNTWNWDWAVAHAPIATTAVASLAFVTAVGTLILQKRIARRRAAFDLFLKTETDEKMLTAYDCFHTGILAMKAAPNISVFCTSDDTRPQYLYIRKYLNIHELVAVGIRRKMLDPKLCYYYWGDTLTNNYDDAKPVLDFLAKRERNKYTYADLHKLNGKWAARKKRAIG